MRITPFHFFRRMIDIRIKKGRMDNSFFITSRINKFLVYFLVIWWIFIQAICIFQWAFSYLWYIRVCVRFNFFLSFPTYTDISWFLMFWIGFVVLAKAVTTNGTITFKKNKKLLPIQTKFLKLVKFKYKTV